ncbi:MAG: hypothetical protein V2B18_16995, partial [Pseudomonadota bacterium]
HVALDDSHVPTEFYEGMRDKKPEWTAKYKDGKFIPFWFKLADIRPVGWDRIADLESLYPNASETVPFNPMDRLSPLKVFERIPYRYFDRTPAGRPYWNQVLADDFWEPGQFKSALIRKVYGDALRRLAVHVIGRLTGPKPELFPLEEIFREALAWHAATAPTRLEDLSRRLAAAFAADEGLEKCGPWDFPLDLEQIAKDLDVEIKHWLGSEVRRIAEARGRPEKDICRKPGKRQLQNWRKAVKEKGW